MSHSVNRRQAVAWFGAATTGSTVVGCGGGGPPPLDEAIAANLLETTADNEAATFRSVDRLYPVRPIRRGTRTAALRPHRTSLAALTFPTARGTTGLDDYMVRHRCAGLIVLKDGAVALERYAMGNGPGTRWTSFSAAKSLTSTLIGAALQDGLIHSLDDPVVRYVAELKGSSYEPNTVRQLLRMTSGVRWVEDYTAAGDSDIARLGEAWASGRAGAVLDLMRSRGRADAPGRSFNYSTGESYVLGCIVNRAAGAPLADYLSAKIWQPAGMQDDGYWVLDSVGGLEMGGNNFSATLRDYARIGLFMAEGGTTGGQRALPANWLGTACAPDTPVTGYGALYPGYPLGYGYQWWCFPSGFGGWPFHDGAFAAIGIFGQFIYINPRHQVVAAAWHAWREPANEASEFELYALLSAAVDALR